MERDPLRFIWRRALARHLLVLLLLLLALPLLWGAIDLVRVLVDDVLLGRAFAAGQTEAPLLRFAIAVPERIALEPIVLFPGVLVPRGLYPLAAGGALVALVVALALVFTVIGALRTATGVSGVAGVRRAVMDAILGTRPSIRDEARIAATLAGPELADLARALGGVWIVPLAAGAVAVVAGAYVVTVDWRLALVLIAGMAFTALAGARRLHLAGEADQARRLGGVAAQRAMTDLIRRLPAVRAHGTAALERDRIAGELDARGGTASRIEARRNLAGAASALLPALAAAAIIAAALALGLTPNPVTPGELAAAVTGSLAALAATGQLARWSGSLGDLRSLFEELAVTLGAMQARGGAARAGATLPAAGALVARSVAAFDPGSGARLSGLDLSLAFPAHVALTGPPGAGAEVFAALLGGQLDPTAGTLTFGGVELAGVDSQARARRIAYCGGETILIAGTLRRNLTYGCPDAEGAELDKRLIEAATVAGLDELIYARGLAGTIDPVREPKLAAALIDGRRAVRAALAAEGSERFVDPFDPKAYNDHATIAENILFGVPLGDTFRETNLPSNPFVRAILEAEQLTKPLADMGASIARSMVEIFSGLPDDHPLFERFAFFSAAERTYFADLVDRLGERRRGGSDGGRDRERLIGLALRYNESRHRLGLLTPDLEARLLTARASFSGMLPTSLQPSIEFYAPDRITAAASLQDNLLFGRIAGDLAGAEREVRRVLRRVLADRGLDQEVVRVGLETRVDPRGETLLPTEIAAIDLARSLVRRPDVVVVERALDGLTGAMAERLVARLRRALVGRGLVLVTPEVTPAMDSPPFDAVLRFDRGQMAELRDRRAARDAEPQEDAVSEETT